MKRRSLLKRLGLAAVAGIALPAAAQKVVANTPKAMTVRKGMPKLGWRKINEGISPQILPSRHNGDIIDIMTETNQILADMPWKEAN